MYSFVDNQSLEELSKLEAETITVYELLRSEFTSALDYERRKYPLSDREKIFETIILKLLDALNTSTIRR